MNNPLTVNRFQPLKRVLVHDVFSRGHHGWMEIMPNFCEAPDFGESPSILSKHQWPAAMLSSATFRYPGTHGALSGTYSLKVSTRPVCGPYEEPPVPGSMGHAIKRLSFHHLKRKYLQFEMWFAFTAEQDKVDGEGELPGLHENSIRSFGAGFDLQERGNRYFVGARYLNSVNGELQKKWQFISPADVTDKEWAYGTEGDWCKKGVDPFWFGRRYSDGSHDGFKDVPNGQQDLCYNETDCKINWQYFRLLFDTENRKYVEMQCQDQTYDLSDFPIEVSPPYDRIDGLMNPLLWVENDAKRRVFLFVDSVVVSQE